MAGDLQQPAVGTQPAPHVLVSERVIRAHVCHVYESATAQGFLAELPWPLDVRFEIVESLADAELVLFSVFDTPNDWRIPDNEGAIVPPGKYERVLLSGENTRPRMEHCEWAFDFVHDETVGDPHHLRFPLYAWCGPLACSRRLLDSGRRLAPQSPSGFCSFVVRNSRPIVRRWLFRALSRYRRVDAPGDVGRNCAPIGPTVEDKLAFMAARKFAITCENSSVPGYVTEKLPDALAAGTVPIYWGAPDVHLEFNEATFINWHRYERRVGRWLNLGRSTEMPPGWRRWMAIRLAFIAVCAAVVYADRSPRRYARYFEQSPLTERSIAMIGGEAARARCTEIIDAVIARRATADIAP